MSLPRLVVLSSLLLPGSVAFAETTDETADSIAARAPANDDAFSPVLAAAAWQGRAVTTATLTLNRVTKTSPLDIHGEVQVWGPFRLVLRVDNVFGDSGGNARPGIGAAMQFLDERKHGVAASAYVQYKAEGFTEGEGEIEGLVSFGKQLGAVHGTLNLAYGQDPEAVERDGEVALGLHVEPIRGLFTGVVGRFRDALGSNGDKGTGLLRDALGGASATYVIGNFGLTAMAGYGGVETKTSGSMQGGAQAAFSVGAVF